MDVSGDPTASHRFEPPDAARLKRRRKATLRRIHDEALLYDAAAHELLYLNSAALQIWAEADGSLSLRELIERYARDMDRAPEDAGREVNQAVDAMLREGWIEWN